jgi:hypothetical protein
MTEKPDPPQDEKPDADEVFAATLRNLVNTPHKPHEKSPSAVKKSGAKGRKAS